MSRLSPFLIRFDQVHASFSVTINRLHHYWHRCARVASVSISCDRRCSYLRTTDSLVHHITAHQPNSHSKSPKRERERWSHGSSRLDDEITLDHLIAVSLRLCNKERRRKRSGRVHQSPPHRQGNRLSRLDSHRLHPSMHLRVLLRSWLQTRLALQSIISHGQMLDSIVSREVSSGRQGTL